jgi:hypothetical protein
MNQEVARVFIFFFRVSFIFIFFRSSFVGANQSTTEEREERRGAGHM